MNKLFDFLFRFLTFATLGVCCSTNIIAREYHVRLLDKADRQPVAYAVIGISGTGIGSYSDENGNAALNIGKENNDKTLAVSLIGYEDYNIKVSELTDRPDSGNYIIYLAKTAYKLEEVVIKPQRLTFAELGNEVDCDTSETGGLPMPYFFQRKKSNVNDTLTEVGTLMKVKHRKTYIDSVQINVGKCTYEHIFYRLNIYEKIDGQFKNILKEPIYIERNRKDVGRTIKVDLTGKRLVVNNNFIVSIEKVKDLGPGELTICGKMLGASMYVRAATRLEQFFNVPIVGMGIAAFVTFSEDY